MRILTTQSLNTNHNLNKDKFFKSKNEHTIFINEIEGFSFY